VRLKISVVPVQQRVKRSVVYITCVQFCRSTRFGALDARTVHLSRRTKGSLNNATNAAKHALNVANGHALWRPCYTPYILYSSCSSRGVEREQ